ncbi:MAG: hypothetical protein SOV27_04655 [Eubacteriales bacterium]|nr:hypothetical protein [Eubacteriales bacterium]
MENYLLKNKKIKNICLMYFALICTLFSFCLSFGGNTLKADAPIQVRVIYSNANVYSLTNIADENNKVIATYKYNQKFNTIGDVITGEDGYEYYKVEISVNEYTFGYVFKSQVADASISSPQIKINYNATVISDCEIYNLNGNNYEETGEKLTNGTKVRILSGYNKLQEYTQIQYLNADGEIVVSYIKTTALKTSGISRTLIGTILIIITTASLVLIIFGVKGKGKKRRK